MTCNDFREDGWQDTKMRKPAILGVAGGSQLPASRVPTPGGEARKDV